jgi:hypothetical protein
MLSHSSWHASASSSRSFLTEGALHVSKQTDNAYELQAGHAKDECNCGTVSDTLTWKTFNKWSLSADPCWHFDLLQKLRGIWRLIIMQSYEWHFLTFLKARHSSTPEEDWSVVCFVHVHRCTRILNGLQAFIQLRAALCCHYLRES